MPNIATPEAQVTITPLETLSYGGESKNAPDWLIRGKAVEAQQRGRELRAQREAGKTGKQVLEEQRERGSAKPFESKKIKALELRFGGGAAKEDGREVVIDTDKNPSFEQIDSFTDAKDAAEKIGKVLLYAEVAAEHTKTGKSPADILSDRGVLDRWEDVRTAGLDVLLQNDNLRQAIPELQDLGPESLQREFLEGALAKDPKFQAKIAEKMRDISQRASTLSEVPKDQQTEEAKVLQAQAETQMQSGWGKMRQALEAEGYDVSKLEASQAEIDRLIKEGVSYPQIANLIREAVLRGSDFSKRAEIEAYIALQKQRQQVLTSLQQAGKNPPLTDRYSKDLDGIEAKIADIDGKYTPEEYEHYVKVTTMFGGEDVSGKFGQYKGLLEQDIKQTVAAGGKYASAEQTIRARNQEAAKLEQKGLSERLRQESELIDELKDVLPDAIAEILLERHDEMVQLQMESREKKNESGVELGLKIIEDAMNKNWIEYNDKTREKTIHRDAIGQDVRFAAYHGDEGIKRLMLRDMGNRDWRDVDLTTLPEVQTKMLEQAYTTHGQAYKDRLLTDFFTAKDFRDGGFKVGFKNWKIEGSYGALGLKEHEWKLLEQNFGKDLDKRLEASQEGAKMLQEMKDRKVVPNFKSKWLMYLLLLLGGVGTVVAGPMAGVLAVGAAGAAGKSSTF